MTTSQCERQGREARFRSLNTVICGSTDAEGIFVIEHLKLDSPPDQRGIWPPYSGEKGEEKEVFIFVEAPRFS